MGGGGGGKRNKKKAKNTMKNKNVNGICVVFTKESRQTTDLSI